MAWIFLRKDGALYVHFGPGNDMKYFKVNVII
jgi:hypothetical protein